MFFHRCGIDDKDFRIVRIYIMRKAAIKLTEGLTKWTDIKQGIRYGCAMSPDLFNLCREFILRELKEVEEGNQENGRCINNILRCFVRSVLMYGCEIWTLTAKIRKNITAAEM